MSDIPKQVADATLSDCGRFRYRLLRSWGDGDHACFIMLNPSTADAMQDDPTIRKCVAFAKLWNLAGIEVVNLFALRSPKPEKLREVIDPVGPENDDYIRSAIQNSACAKVVAAWGVNGDFLGRGLRVRRMLTDLELRVWAFRIGKTGNPDHPLYQPYSREMVRYV